MKRILVHEDEFKEKIAHELSMEVTKGFLKERILAKDTSNIADDTIKSYSLLKSKILLELKQYDIVKIDNESCRKIYDINKEEV